MNCLFFGLGRIGLPQALVFASKGFRVYGYDSDEKVLQLLRKAQPPFFEPKIKKYLSNYLNRWFFPVGRWEEVISQVDVLFFTFGITVPNAEDCLNDDDLNISEIKHTIDQIMEHKDTLREDVLFVLRPTLPIGYTDKIKNYIESNCGVYESKDFYLVFVPERLAEGRAITEEETLPKIVGAYTDDGFRKAEEVFGRVGGKIIRVSSPKVAEFCKLVDNSYRGTLFALVNDFALLASEIGIDATEVINAVNTDYSRNRIPQPGFVSGYCLGKDPYIFERKFNNVARLRNFQSLWYFGRRINDYLIDYTADRVLRGMKSLKKKVNDSVVAILGVSYKEDVDDFRMSHSIDIMKKLTTSGVRSFNVFDPNLHKNEYTILPDEIAKLVKYKSRHISPRLFEDTDIIIITHRHKSIRSVNGEDRLRELLPTGRTIYIFDGWNVWRDASRLENVVYEGLGFRG